jgi:DNA-binding NarL/FixJ family response regulator
MDVRMPGLDGIKTTQRIRSTGNANQGPKIIILTTFDLDEYVLAGLQAGASGFLLKDTLAADLLSAVRVVAAGQAVAAPSVTRHRCTRASHRVVCCGHVSRSSYHRRSVPPVAG